MVPVEDQTPSPVSEILSLQDKIGPALAHLLYHDHSTPFVQDPRDPTPESYLAVARQTVKLLWSYEAQSANPDLREQIDYITSELTSGLKGYEYRRSRRLPGLGAQLLAIRRSMVSAGDYSAELNTLQQQPDAGTFVDQLRREHEVFENVLEGGGILDLDSLSTKVWKTFEGISLMPSEDIEVRLQLIDDLAFQAIHSYELASVQKRPELIDETLSNLETARSHGLLALADSLETVISRLELEGRLPSSDHTYTHETNVARLNSEGNVIPRLQETVTWMAEKLSLDPETVMAEGIDVKALVLERSELQVKIDALRLEAGRDDIFAAPARLLSRLRGLPPLDSRLRELQTKAQRLDNILEGAEDLSTARKYLLAERDHVPFLTQLSATFSKSQS